ncbi:unnamed protein product [Prorocentrum cordatum]|uniref:peptidyl-tRNA hydrolase n=2 Tax=Prorocentrum cordatum TaxID=2364126 RepID=A0ABN9WR26_9DINO|nr:unnamed protein product [Polarella glacialis]
MGVPALLITPRAPPFPPPRGGNERYPPEIRRCDNMRDREKSRLDPTFLVSLSRQIDLWWSQGPSTGRKRLARKHLQRLGLPAPGSKRTVSMAVAFAMKRKKELMRAWDDDGAMIVVLEVADAKGLAQLRAAAKKHGLATQVVEDEGRTEVEGGAWTVLAIGPHDSARVDAVTGSLALYGGPRASSERPAAAEEGELSRLRAELAEARHHSNLHAGR